MYIECIFIAELTEKVVDIIKAHQTIDSETSGEIELDFESLSDSTMHELEAFLQKEQDAANADTELSTSVSASASAAAETIAPELQSTATETAHVSTTSIEIHEATPPHAPDYSAPLSPAVAAREPDSPTPSQSALVIASSSTPPKTGEFFFKVEITSTQKIIACNFTCVHTRIYKLVYVLQY